MAHYPYNIFGGVYNFTTEQHYLFPPINITI